ncbi:MAG TPA: cytochrome c-type biogenesis protein CcmH [Candidatus Acidoferrales bacterium]|nr:cytochrome c-type biogenesis protein CcmH [Candidatus Acidoferrales bacterium]
MARTKTKPRFWVAFAVVTLLGAGFAMLPAARAQQTDHAKRLGMKLMCMCGCGQVLVQCNHINCPSSGPMLKELDERIARGEADDLVTQDFIQEYGVAVLSSPPNKGFNRVAWILPGFAFAAGLGLVMLVIQQWRKRVPAAQEHAKTSDPKVSAEMLARVREQARHDTED